MSSSVPEPNKSAGATSRPARGCVIAAVAASLFWLAGPAAAQVEFSDADADQARRLVKKRCAKCHGEDGRGMKAEYASLAGQPAEYLLKQLFNFKTGQRRHAKMQAIADRLSARESYLLAEYFARLRPGFTESLDEAARAAGRRLYFEGNPATGVHDCVSCHGVYATGGGVVARLAGQNPVYLETQLGRLIERSRGNDRAMHAINGALTQEEIRSLAIYLAAEQ